MDDEDALDEVRAPTERIRAGVWISPLSGRSGFPESHPLFQGFLPPVPTRWPRAWRRTTWWWPRARRCSRTT
ncbi:hypothetical protein ABZ471_42045 [Streptomyces sp. NPDC005728]|uniref:hypothetical protein n=1 Tax=Streptomyces sp. NPDC005728 TaxID=3157054 RepID=UPI0033FEDEF5